MDGSLRVTRLLALSLAPDFRANAVALAYRLHPDEPKAQRQVQSALRSCGVVAGRRGV